MVGELASLPRGIIDAYKQRGVTTLFPWQRQCLQVDGVLRSQRSLVYVAPTSGGKSLIAEVLACRTLHLLRKKVLYVVPYVSMVREVGDRLASLFDGLKATAARTKGFQRDGLRVQAFHGRERGAPDAHADVYVCTIEKAAAVFNALIAAGTLGSLGLVVADEVHMLGDERGAQLEALLTRCRHLRRRTAGARFEAEGRGGRTAAAAEPAAHDAAAGGGSWGRAVGAAAARVHVGDAAVKCAAQLSRWLDAALFTSDFRPVELQENFVCNGALWRPGDGAKAGTLVRADAPLSRPSAAPKAASTATAAAAWRRCAPSASPTAATCSSSARRSRTRARSPPASPRSSATRARRRRRGCHSRAARCPTTARGCSTSCASSTRRAR